MSVAPEAGWFAVGNSDELASGEVRPGRCLDRDLAVWRGEDGRVRALPARCPHAGADMAKGRVHGNWLECPFHTWRWDESGALRDIPYSVKPIAAPTADRPPVWPTCEIDGRIMVWHHPD